MRGTPAEREDALFIERLIAFCARKSLPLDFITWHDYHIDPSTTFDYHGQQVSTARALLKAYGFDPDAVELINDEWNDEIFGSPATANRNTTHVNAAHAASTMIAFHQAGLTNQAAQAMVDTGPGDEMTVLSHFVTKRGLPRAAFNAFAMLGRLDGEERGLETSHRFLRAVAFEGASETNVIVSLFTPHAQMSFQSVKRWLTSNDPARDQPSGVAFATYLCPTPARHRGL